jgi:phage shock protein E
VKGDLVKRWMILLTMIALLAGGCAATEQAGSGPAPAEIGAEEIESRVLVDVRTPAEHAEGNLPGSLNLDVNAPNFRDQVDALPRDDAYLVYCRSGNRSAQAVAIMSEMGFTDVVDGGAYADLAAAAG